MFLVEPPIVTIIVIMILISISHFSLRQRAFKESDKITMHYPAEIVLFEPAGSQQFGDSLKFGNALKVASRLLAAEPAVQVRADADVARVSGYLAEMIDVRHNVFDCQAGGGGSRLAAHPIG